MCIFDAYYLYTAEKLLVKTASTAALNHRNIVWWVVLVIDPLFTFDYAAILWSSLIHNKHITPSPLHAHNVACRTFTSTLWHISVLLFLRKRPLPPSVASSRALPLPERSRALCSATCVTEAVAALHADCAQM